MKIARDDNSIYSPRINIVPNITKQRTLCLQKKMATSVQKSPLRQKVSEKAAAKRLPSIAEGVEKESILKRQKSSVKSVQSDSASSEDIASLRYHPPTGQLEPRVKRQNRLADLVGTLTKKGDTKESVQKHLVEADKCIQREKYADAIPHLEAALVAAGDSSKLQCVLWRLLGNAHLSQGHFKKASVCHMHQLAFCRELDDFAGMTMAECNLGIAYMKLGLLKLAGRCFSQYLENSRVLQDDMGIAYACSNLGMLAKSMAVQEYMRMEGSTRQEKFEKGHSSVSAFTKHLHKAIAAFEQHLEIVERHSDLDKQARVYANLGSCHEMLHEFSKAIFCHRKRLDIVRSTGDRVGEICTLCNLGNSYRAIGQLENALENYSIGLELCQVMNDKAGESIVLLNLGTTCELLGQLDKAIEWYTMHLSMCVEGSDLHGQARAFNTLARLYQRTGQMVKSHDHYKKLVAVYHELGDGDSETMARYHLMKSQNFMQKQKTKYTKISKNRPLKKKSPTAGRKEYNTWSPRTAKWYDDTSTGMGTLPTNFIIKNKTAYRDTLQQDALQRDHSKLFQAHSIADELHVAPDGSIFDDMLKSVRPSFYTIGDFMEPVQHRVSSPDGSATEYEELEDGSDQEGHHRSVTSKRHSKDLHQVQQILNPQAVSDNDEADDEWAEWLLLQQPKALQLEQTDHSLTNEAARKRVPVRSAPPPPPPFGKQKQMGLKVSTNNNSNITQTALRRSWKKLAHDESQENLLEAMCEEFPRKPKSIIKNAGNNNHKYVNKAPPPPKAPPLPPPIPTTPRPSMGHKRPSFSDSSLTISNDHVLELQHKISESKLI